MKNTTKFYQQNRRSTTKSLSFRDAMLLALISFLAGISVGVMLWEAGVLRIIYVK